MRLAIVVALGSLSGLPAAASVPTQLELRANARASGNEHDRALALARTLLATQWPAQVVRVRIDGVAGHRVAGIVLEGEKFHSSLSLTDFLDEARGLVDATFAASDVEEVDVWATLPIPVSPGTIVSGDLAHPTTRPVFSATARRVDLDSFAHRWRSGEGVFVDPEWRRSLRGEVRSGPSANGSGSQDAPPR